MIKFTETDIVMTEVPNMITLAINLSKCPNRCTGCHSPQLKEDIGLELTTSILNSLIHSNEGIDCICLMGGDNDQKRIVELAKFIRSKNLKVAWYSGRDTLYNIDYTLFDFIKIGQYIEERGALDSPTTNQFMFEIKDKELIDITDKFLIKQ